MSSPKLKALLIGINNYGTSNLKGCLNDVDLMESVIREQVESDVELAIKTLKDQQATYQNVIDTFLEFFSDLKNGDQALLYYSGHGSRMKAPPEFHQDASNEYIETFVLFDSRRGGGRDLADKELAYLNWKVTRAQGKNVFFTMIFDSCFSGGMLRGEEALVRHDPNPNEDRSWQDFLGSEEYDWQEGKIHVPEGDKVVLAACRPDEVSVEYFLEGKQQGLFTYNLAKVLRASNGKLTFAEIMQRVKARIHTYTTHQHPQLQNAEWLNIDHQVFLASVLKYKPSTHLLFYNYEPEGHMPKGWIVDIGTIHGLDSTYNKNQKIQLQITAPLPAGTDDIIAIESIGQSYSTVIVPDKLAKKDEQGQVIQYEVVLTSYPAQPLNFGFPFPSSENDPLGEQILIEEWKRRPSIYLQFVENWYEANYLIYAKDNRYWLRAMGEASNYLFDQLQGFTPTNANQLFFNLEKIAKWHRIKSAQNPKSRIVSGNIELSFYEVKKVPRINEVEITDIISPGFLIEEPILKYYPQSGKNPELDASFKLKIKNKSDRELWFSVLFIGSDYSISNNYLVQEKLAPNKEVWLKSYTPKGLPTKSIDLFIEDVYIRKGISRIIEYFKIIISTHEFSTDHLNQGGISYDSQTKETPMRSVDDEKTLKFQSDWTCIDFSVCIKHQREA